MNSNYARDYDTDKRGREGNHIEKGGIRDANPGSADTSRNIGNKGDNRKYQFSQGKSNTNDLEGKDKKYIIVKGERFVNPYNFIPLEDECIREIPDTGKSSTYTGYYDCSLRLLTHLFIPNTSSYSRLISNSELNDEEKRSKDYVLKGYDFFSYNDWSGTGVYEGLAPSPPSEPVIPGSELRGAVRSVYEAAFNGCMSSIDGERDISRRVIEVKKPGFLRKENGRWCLKPCRKVRLRVEQLDEQEKNEAKCNKRGMVSRGEYNTWKEGQEIWVRVGKRDVAAQYKICNPKLSEASNSKPIGFKKGYLHKGEYIKKKKYESVFLENQETDDENSIPVSDGDVKLLRSLLSEYKDEKKNQKAKDSKWYDGYEVLEEGTLVYYSETEEGHIYLSPACISKELFIKKIGSILKNNGNYQPCTGKKLCTACQIFGMMEKAERPETYAYGSKVRITDAKLVNPEINVEELFAEPLVLPELGKPRPGAVEFYTQSPYIESDGCLIGNGRGFWTYDYMYKKSGNKTIAQRVELNVGIRLYLS